MSDQSTRNPEGGQPVRPIVYALCGVGLLLTVFVAHKIESSKKDGAKTAAEQAGDASGADDSSKPLRSMMPDRAFKSSSGARVKRDSESVSDSSAEAIIEKARANPLVAVAMASKEEDEATRRAMFEATLKIWGASDPDAAAQWVLGQNFIAFDSAASALFAGAAANPAAAMETARTMMEKRPEFAQETGSRLIRALGEKGEYETAAAFAASCGEDVRVELIEESFARWAASDPAQAAEAAMALEDQGDQTMAFSSAVSIWAESDPKTLANYSLTLSEGSAQTAALNEAMQAWAIDDSASLEIWLAALDPATALDYGAFSLATQSSIIQQNPTLAAGWAQTITDDTQRSNALAAVITQWAASDPAAARAYAESTTELNSETRQFLMDYLNNLSWDQEQ